MQVATDVFWPRPAQKWLHASRPGTSNRAGQAAAFSSNKSDSRWAYRTRHRESANAIVYFVNACHKPFALCSDSEVTRHSGLGKRRSSGLPTVVLTASANGRVADLEGPNACCSTTQQAGAR